jgi:hypothetical protein
MAQSVAKVLAKRRSKINFRIMNAVLDQNISLVGTLKLGYVRMMFEITDGDE